jgi:hypothetical protein
VAAPSGNKFWLQRSSHGRKPIFSTPDDLWNAACEYFEWVEENPLKETKAFHFQGTVVMDEVPKMRAMTMMGLCFYLDIGTSTFHDYKQNEDFSEVIAKIEQVIFTQKFEGAAADLLNANIISRELGLADKQQVEHSGSISDMTEDEIDKRIAELQKEN